MTRNRISKRITASPISRYIPIFPRISCYFLITGGKINRGRRIEDGRGWSQRPKAARFAKVLREKPVRKARVYAFLREFTLLRPTPGHWEPNPDSTTDGLR